MSQCCRMDKADGKKSALMLHRVRSLRTYAFIHAHVVDEHRLRKLRRGARGSGPIPSDRDIENEEERMVEDPRVSIGGIGGRSCLELHLVRLKANASLVPFDRVDVEVVGERRVVR